MPTHLQMALSRASKSEKQRALESEDTRLRNRNVSELMRSHRRKLGLTLEQMGALMGISATYLSEMETGCKPYRLKFIARAQLALERNGHNHR